jgi:amino acid transporter
MRKAAGLLGGAGDLPEGFWYSVKRRILGPPLVNEQLTHQRLSNPLALGVLSPDGISSSAYGTEEILIALLPVAGLAAFTLILPLTLVILVVMTLVVLSYREVVMVYIRPGGSYVVTRENFGPKVAQVTAVALLIDYVVTVAVQISAGTAAVASAFPALAPFTREITIGVILLMAFGNLRGIREAGRTFAVPTYLFSGSVILMIVVGVIREALGKLPSYHPQALPDHIEIGAGTTGLISFAMILTLLRAFANGGASLTGIEAVSDSVGAFRPPEGANARRVLVTEGLILGFLVAGISWLAHATHATPRWPVQVPTVLAQEAQIVFGHSFAGQALFLVVQAASALILYTGGNTSFNGFPFLASYVAGDAFLPRWLLKRGHRLVFSNAIVVLAVLSTALVITRGASVNNLVPLYAIGVFTAFTMAGFGMARYHSRHRSRGWQRRRAVNGAAGALSAIVVIIFAVVKFMEGAWLVVVLFPILTFALIRLNREYRAEAQILQRIGDRPKPPEPPLYPRRTVYLLVDSFDLATLAALRYAKSLRPTTLRAVHFVIDNVQADRLREEWSRANRDVVLDFVDCPDRRLARASAELVSKEAAQPGTHVTVVLPRRSYSPLLGRLLHDRTADKIAAVVSRIPDSAATIVPFDVKSRLVLARERAEAPAARTGAAAGSTGAAAEPPAVAGAVAGAAAGTVAGPAPEAGSAALTGTPGAPAGAPGPAAPAQEDVAAALGVPPPAGTPARDGVIPGGIAAPGPHRPAGPPLPPGTAAARSRLRTLLRGRQAAREGDGAGGVPRGHADYERPPPPPGVHPIGTLAGPGKATVEGRVRAVEIRPVERNAVLAAEISDATGDLTALFYGRSHIPGLVCGARVRFRGRVGVRDGSPFMINPAYELLPPNASPPAGEGTG